MADIKKPNRFSGLMQTLKQESEGGKPSETDSSEVESGSASKVLSGLISTSSSVLPSASSSNGAPGSPTSLLAVPLAKIHPDPDQDRRYFDPIELANLATSIQSVGLIDPLTVRVRPSGTDEYDLLAGEKRYRASKLARVKTILVRVLDVDDATADDIRSISNLQRSDLNAWEETRAIMRMLCRHLVRSQEEVISLLNQAANQKRGLTSNVVRKEDWAIVQDVFELTGRLTPESYRKHRLPLLRLPEHVEATLQQGSLHYTKVNEILKVKDPQLQQQILEAAATEGLSTDQIKSQVKSLRVSRQPQTDTVAYRLTTVSKQLKQAKVWNDPARRKKLEKLLADMEALLS
jgi:ParB family chromosome partitioning protein